MFLTSSLSLERLYPSSLVEVSKSLKMLRQNKFGVWKKFCVRNKFWFQNNCGSVKKFRSEKNVGVQKLWVQNIFRRKSLCLRNFLANIFIFIVLIDSTKNTLGYRRLCWVTFEIFEYFRFLRGPNGGLSKKIKPFFLFLLKTV